MQLSDREVAELLRAWARRMVFVGEPTTPEERRVAAVTVLDAARRLEAFSIAARRNPP